MGKKVKDEKLSGVKRVKGEGRGRVKGEGRGRVKGKMWRRKDTVKGEGGKLIG